MVADEGLCMRVNSLARYGDAHRLAPRLLRRLLATGDEDTEVAMVAATATLMAHASVRCSAVTCRDTLRP